MVVNVYEIGQADLSKVKEILEAPDLKQEDKWVINEFKKQGYRLQEGKAIQEKEEAHYLKIDASKEFFEKNEKVLLDAGAKKLSEDEAKKIDEKLKKIEEEKIAGMGAVFGEE